MSRIEGKQKGGRSHLGRRSEAQHQLERQIKQTILHPAEKQGLNHDSGGSQIGSPLTKLFLKLS